MRCFSSPGLLPSLALRVIGLATDRVSPFGNPGITACLQLPQAYRSLARPSSPPCAKASSVRPYALDIVASRCDSSNTTHLTNVSCQRAELQSSVVGNLSSGTDDRSPMTDDVVESRAWKERATSETFRSINRPTRYSRNEGIHPQV